jgi:hypothetical protein
LKLFSGEVDRQLSLFSKTQTLAEKATLLKETREELRIKKLKEPSDDEMSSDSDGEIDWRKQNIF